MKESPKTVLVVGSTGSIGRLVVEEAVRQGYVVRALVRSVSKDLWHLGTSQLVFSTFSFRHNTRTH